MNRKYTFSTLILLIFAQIAISQTTQDRLHYIDKYKHIAQEEMERTGVPASIKLAQAILESNGGKSVLSRKANNHFGIKCGGSWKDRSFYRVDDEKDAKGNDIESCFRVYKNPESSFIAHSEFLRVNKRYEFLFALDHTDYHAWAYGLKKAGYATNPKYPNLLIGIIENYELFQYDNLFEPGSAPMLASTDEAAVIEEVLRQEKIESAKKVFKIGKLNDISIVRAALDDTPEIIAIKTSVPLRRIFKYNENLTDPGQAIPENTVIFLQPKRKAFRGRKKFHKVGDGENIAQVSQKYGIRLDKLLKRNRLAVNQEPLEGAILKIRGKRVDKNLQIPTREVYAAGTTKKKNSKMAKDKFATSISDFEAPPTIAEEREIAKQKKKFALGRNKDKNTKTKTTADAAPIVRANPAPQKVEREVVQIIKESETTDIHRAPISSDNYDTNSTSSNVTFKENEPVYTASTHTTVPPGTVTTPTYTTPSAAPTTPASSNSSYSTGNTSYSTGSSPVSSTSASTYSTAPTTVVSTPTTVQTVYHTVVKGETLYRLSKTYGKSVDYIKQVNGLNSNTISIGQKLIVN